MNTRSEAIKKSLLALTITHNTNDQGCALVHTKAINEQSDLLQQDYNHYKQKDVERNSYSIEKLESDLQDQIESEIVEILENDYPQDRLTEMADSSIPIYNWGLCQYLANDFSLAFVDDEGLIEGCTDIFKIIQMSIYERLTAAGYEKMEELKQSKLPHWEYLQEKAQEIIALCEEAQGEEKAEEDQVYWDKLEKVIGNMTEKEAFYTNLIDKLEDF